jgi:hypothetical protein
VDQANGDVYVVFYDRRAYNDRNTDVYLARSVDGGETFENIKISESPFVPSSNIFFGDYTNVAAYDGYVRPIWARLNNGQLSLLTAIVDISVGMNEQVRHNKEPFTIQASYPNPFNETVNIAFKLNQLATVTLTVNDVTGKEVAVLIDHQKRKRGKYVERLNVSEYDMPSGFYYFVLRTDGFVKTQKILLSK